MVAYSPSAEERSAWALEWSSKNFNGNLKYYWKYILLYISRSSWSNDKQTAIFVNMEEYISDLHSACYEFRSNLLCFWIRRRSALEFPSFGRNKQEISHKRK
ncbi:hypothetical protein NPIL_486301 [Nephila pilipes]|uniref:Uncharacterized protein n=1 Tax=Nephila pilipes TaxID=299642 RepID=A0A8X6QE89_NEPPI|nr:hypothetical protein NPIL_486301 [Nephila pilipes]